MNSDYYTIILLNDSTNDFTCPTLPPLNETSSIREEIIIYIHMTKTIEILHCYPYMKHQ